MDVEAQELGFGDFKEGAIAGSLPFLRSPMPALPPDLEPEIVFEVDSKTTITVAEEFGTAVDVVGAEGGVGEVTKEFYDRLDAGLELIGLTEILVFEELLNLPVEPEGGFVEEGSVVGFGVDFEVFIGIFTVGDVEDAKLNFTAIGEVGNFTDGALGGFIPGGVGVKVEDDLFGFGVAEELANLVDAEGCP